MAARSSSANISPPPSSTDHSIASSTLVSHTNHRRSSDSARTMPKFPNSTTPQRRDRSSQDHRSMSMSAVRPSVEQQIKGPTHGRTSPTSIRPVTTTVRKTPIVYPALLSRVAQAFRERIPITDRVKDGLTYKDAFDGREAVDKIAYIIKTTDRNLALLLGRALDAQKFFHDVTYDHRLRDSANELYQFQTKLPSPFVSGELQHGHGEQISPERLGNLLNSASFFEVCFCHMLFFWFPALALTPLFTELYVRFTESKRWGVPWIPGKRKQDITEGFSCLCR